MHLRDQPSVHDPEERCRSRGQKGCKGLTDAAQSLSNFDAQKLLSSHAFSQEITIRGIDDLTDGENSFDGFRLRSDVNIPKRYIGLTGSVLDQRSSMFTVRAAVDDNVAAANVPELLDDDFWAVNTETLGADLTSSIFGLNASDFADVSFNLFDLLNETTSSKEFGDASGKALWKAVTAEKLGKQELRFGGESYSCASYRVLIPQSALEAYVNDYFDYLESTTSDNLQDALADCGFPVEPTSSFARGFSAGYAIGAAASPFDSARENILNALDTLGDIELTAYVSGGYLCGVDWSPSDDEYSSDMLLSIRTAEKITQTISAFPLKITEAESSWSPPAITVPRAARSPTAPTWRRTARSSSSGNAAMPQSAPAIISAPRSMSRRHIRKYCSASTAASSPTAKR